MLLSLGLWAAPEADAQPGARVSFQTFYNELSPYGQWSSNPRYGSVWFPYVDRNFQPYGTNGHWVMTEFGNTWVSDYNWGWAAFHYGRWFYDDYQGWGWVPDYQWGPAWVDWRSSGGYYGWAPLFPGVQFGVSFNIPMNYWVFVPRRYINRRRVFGYCVPRYRVRNIYNQTTIINNYYQNDNRTYAYGPRRDEIERATRRNVPVYRADEVSRGGSYASANRRNSDGSNTADNSSRSGLNRSSRDNGQSVGRSSRGYDAQDNGTARRGYDVTTPDRTRGSRNYDSRSAASSSSRTYQAEPSNRSRGSFDGRSSSDGRTYESSTSPSRSGGNRDVQRSAPSAPSVDRSPSRSRSSYDTPSRSSSSYDRGSSSRNSAPRQSSPAVRSSSPRRSAPAPRRSSPRQSAPATRSSSPQRSAPSVRSSSPRQSAPAPRSSSPSTTTSPRSRGPR